MIEHRCQFAFVSGLRNKLPFRGGSVLTPVLDHQVNAPKDMIVKPIRMVREHAEP